MDFHLDSLLNFPDVTVISCQQQEGLIILNQTIKMHNTYYPRMGTTQETLIRVQASATQWLPNLR